MILFFKKFKINKKLKLNRGMTYVELIVVLSIFSVMSSIVLFNYGKFQARVDIKNLANDIALKFVEAQKTALAGKVQLNAPVDWRPTYGMYFDPTSDKSFIYFADLDSNKNYDISSTCPTSEGTGTGECLSKITITKNDFISSIDSYKNSAVQTHITDGVSTSYIRPDSSAIFHSSALDLAGSFDYLQITISAPQSPGTNAYIRVYPSGRIQIN